MPPTPECTIRAVDLVGAELVQRAGDGFDRALHVALDEQRELLAAGLLQLLHHLLERARRAGRAQRLAALAHAVVGDLAGAAFVLDDRERSPASGRRVEAQDLDRHRRPGLRHVRAAIVDERAHAAPRAAGDDDVADAQGAALDQHGADRTAAALQLGLDDDAFGGAVRVGLQVQDLGLQVDRLEQLVEVRPLQGRDRHLERLARHALDDDLVLQQLGAHAVRIGLRLVDLVDRHDDRHAGGLGVIDGLDRLRHDAVVGRHHQHDDVGHLGAAGAHGGERLVARRVDERDLLADRRRHLVGADVLRDAARLAR